MWTMLHWDRVIVCVLVAVEEVIGGIGAPIRHRLSPSQEYEQKGFMCWIWSHQNIVNKCFALFQPCSKR